jgi:hypothetical protein
MNLSLLKDMNMPKHIIKAKLFRIKTEAILKTHFHQISLTQMQVKLTNVTFTKAITENQLSSTLVVLLTLAELTFQTVKPEMMFPSTRI